MDEKLKQIEKSLIEKRCVELVKQCKKEYIVYEFYVLANDNSVIKIRKYHYTDSSLLICKKNSTNTLINKSLRDVIDNVIYDLLIKGYKTIIHE